MSDQTEPELSPLRYHYGPTQHDKDAGKQWCYDCGGEVLWIKDGPPGEGGYICMGCKRTSEE